ncbi:hypothetical protein [Stappia albiluteola]|uniref:hypothetical protein n=1 Tax=Stappia albiluteola TaxID=2758565 RepID=UPI001F15E360|nr:hypothetical protein [Stappia albiluteola]
MTLPPLPTRLVFSAAFALMAAGCGTSPPADAARPTLARSARAIVGTSLIGARGATPADQEAIDATAAGLCGAAVWTRAECRKHQQAAAVAP